MTKKIVRPKLNRRNVFASSSNMKSQLDDMVESQVYEAYDNYRGEELSQRDVYQIVLDHVIMIIQDMDDDEEYVDLVPVADYDNKSFCSAVKSLVNKYYSEYDW